MTQILNLVNAVDSFVTGCKSDGIWTSIKAGCIMAGWSNLSGALTPLTGVAPSGFNLASGTYNRITGLQGDGAAMYLSSNRNNNVDPQNSQHLSVYRTNTTSIENVWIIAASNVTGASALATTGTANVISIRSRNNIATTVTVSSGVREAPGLIASSRTSVSNVNYRWAGASGSISQTSETPVSANIGVFANQSGAFSTISRLAFYSIGESLDLALLDARVSGLMVALSGAIP